MITDFEDIYFEVKFNNYRDVSGSTANAVTDREVWDTCECVLRLPKSYSDEGEETPLILSCHGAGGSLGTVNKEKGIYGGVHYCSECTKQGYAVLDVCGSQPHGVTMGCPEHIFALHKAYLYAIKHYNLSRNVLALGVSMGGLTVMNFANAFPNVVTAIGLLFPRLNLDGVTIDGHFCRGIWDKTKKSEKSGFSSRDRLMQSFRFPEEQWCGENTVGFNPYLARSVIGADGKRVVFPPCPIKIWHGLQDETTDHVMTKEYVESVRRSGSYIELHLMEGVEHRDNAAMKQEIPMWFNRFI